MTFLAHKHTGCALCSAPLMDKVHFNEIFSKLISHWIDCQRYYERSKLTCDSNPFGIINWFARIFVVKNEENVRAPWHTRNAIFVHSPCPTLRQNVLQLFLLFIFCRSAVVFATPLFNTAMLVDADNYECVTQKEMAAAPSVFHCWLPSVPIFVLQQNWQFVMSAENVYSRRPAVCIGAETHTHTHTHHTRMVAGSDEYLTDLHQLRRWIFGGWGSLPFAEKNYFSTECYNLSVPKMQWFWWREYGFFMSCHLWWMEAFHVIYSR